MQQTDFPFEINLGEDESTDGTRETCIEYAQKYPDIINLFLNERKNVIYINGNPTGRWNFMNNIKNARGKYIALCPGDDYWTDDRKLQKQIDYLEANPEFSACFTAASTYYRGSLGVFNRQLESIESADLDDILIGNPYCAATMVFRNKLWTDLPSWFFQMPGVFWPLAVLRSLSTPGAARATRWVIS